MKAKEDCNWCMSVHADTDKRCSACSEQWAEENRECDFCGGNIDTENDEFEYIEEDHRYKCINCSLDQHLFQNHR